ncbi:MAG: uracil phosphoribosyltransferase, partial [Acutalibacteraceae bacterium]
MSNVTITNHPLIQHKLSILRRKDTSSRDFRSLISEIAMLL